MFHPTKRRLASPPARTSGVERHYPFQVELVSGFPLRCHLGRVNDPESKADFGRQQQKSWPHYANKISQKGLPKAKAYNRAEQQYKDLQLDTGSAVIHQISGQGRATYGSASAISQDKAYAEWSRASMNEVNYVILHREVEATQEEGEIPQAKWCLSSVSQASIMNSDIVIGIVVGWKTVHQVWKSDLNFVNIPTEDEDPPPTPTGDHPFKVIMTGTTASITQGTVNNVMISNGAATFTVDTGEYSVLIKATCVGLTYPNEVIWSVVQNWNPYNANTVNEGWVKVAHISNGVPSQFIFTSLMSERVKLGQGLNMARYYFNRV